MDTAALPNLPQAQIGDLMQFDSTAVGGQDREPLQRQLTAATSAAKFPGSDRGQQVQIEVSAQTTSITPWTLLKGLHQTGPSPQQEFVWFSKQCFVCVYVYFPLNNKVIYK